MNKKSKNISAVSGITGIAVKILLTGAMLLVLAACGGQEPNKILMVVADVDFYDPEYLIPREELEAAGYVVEVASIDGGKAVGLNGFELETDLAVKDADAKRYRSLLLVGGYGAVQFYGNQELIQLVKDFDAQEKVIGGQCYSPVVIGEAGLLDGVNATCWSTQEGLLSDTGANYTGNLVEVSGRIVTGVSGPEANVHVFTDAYMAELERDPETRSEPVTSSNGTQTQDRDLPDAPFTLSSDNKSFSMVHGGLTRTGAVFVPESPDNERPRSLLIGLHGMNSQPTSFQQVGFDAYAARNNFVNIYPAAMNGAWEVEFGINHPDDDVGFIKRLIEEAVIEFDIDPDRVYLTGHSNGAFMTYRLAAEIPDLLAAAAPVSGAIVAPDLALRDIDAVPLPLMHLHGVDDPVVPIPGIPGYTKSVIDSVKFWNAINGNEEMASSYSEYAWGRSRADVKVWRDGDAPVKSIIYSGGGHAWPISATDEIMGFFTQNPPLEDSIDFDDTVLPLFAEPGDSVSIEPDLSRLDIGALERIELIDLNDDAVVAVVSAAPWELEIRVTDYALYDLELRAVFSDGTSIRSERIQRLAVVGMEIPGNANVFASSDESDDLPAVQAADADLNTRWASEFADNQELILDLGGVTEISGVTLLWEVASAQSYRIEVSEDGENWNVVASIDQGRGGIEQSNFDTVSARYMKLNLENRATEWGFSLWEIFVY